MSRDIKELFEQRLVWDFDQNGRTWRRKSNNKTPQLTLLHFGRTVRSSHRKCSIKKHFLKTFAIFPGKNLCWSLFSITFLKLDSTQVFPVVIANFFMTTYFENICEGVLIDCFNVHCYAGLKVQGLYCTTASGFRVRVTGLVILF